MMDQQDARGGDEHVKMEGLAGTIGEWLKGTGPESDIVMSSRVRLARNVAHFPFVSRATDQERTDVEEFLRGQIVESTVGQRLDYINVEELDEVDRQFLVERQLISREHAEAEGAR
jgi:protein arginine kinase